MALLAVYIGYYWHCCLGTRPLPAMFTAFPYYLRASHSPEAHAPAQAVARVRPKLTLPAGTA